MFFAFGETVTRLRPGIVADPYSSEPTSAWELSDGETWETEPTELAIPGCGVALGGSTEPLIDARNAVDSDFDVFMPTGTDVTAQDRLVIRGLVCDVAGRPFDWRHPMTGWQPGLVAQAKIREG